MTPQDQQPFDGFPVPPLTSEDHISAMLAYVDTTWGEEDGLPEPEEATAAWRFLAGEQT